MSIYILLGPEEGEKQNWLDREKKRMGSRCLIHPALIEELTEMLGEENVVLK